MLIVPVSGIRPESVLFVVIWTFKVKQTFGTAAKLIGPIASLDTFVIKQSIWFTLAALWYAPSAFTIKHIALIMIVFRKKSKLPRTSGCAHWLSYKASQGQIH